MKIKTLNSEYEIKENSLYRNGELYTDKITFAGSMMNDFTRISYELPKVGDMLYIEYLDKNNKQRSIRTSIVQEVREK